MSKRSKILLGIGAAVFAGLIAWTILTIPDAPEISDQPDEPPVMTYDDNTIHEEKNGRKIWELNAEHMSVELETQNIKLEKITGHFYAEDGRTVEVLADGGSYDNETKDIVINGHVDIHTSDGARLTGDELRWSSQDEVLAAVGNATASKDDMKASGDRIESTDGFNKIKIIGKAHLVKGGNEQ